MTNEERAYYAKCDAYDSAMTYEEYVVHIFRCLILSDWHYSAETAMSLIRERADCIRKAFEEKQSVIEAMVEVGYC